MLDKDIEELRRHWRPLFDSRPATWRPDPVVQQATLERVLATPRRPAPPQAPRRRPVRRWLASAGIVIVAMLAILAIRPAAAPADQATPLPLTYRLAGDPKPAAPLLRELAAVAARTPAGPSGPVAHLETVSWDLSSRITGGHSTSVVIPQRQSFWLRADGSGRSVRQNLPAIPARLDGRPADVGEGHGPAGSTRSTEVFGEGGFPRAWTDSPPTETVALRAWLRAGDAGIFGDPAWAVLTITRLLQEQVLGPPQRAAVLRLLAEEPSITYVGTTTDRSARPGLAFAVTSSVHGLPARHVLVVDPGTGRILAHEESLLDRVGRLDVEPYSVIGFETYLTAEFVPDLP
jgi:hypothetical protein